MIRNYLRSLGVPNYCERDQSVSQADPLISQSVDVFIELVLFHQKGLLVI
ncbi:hypothetical protein [Nostoc sp.]